METDEVLEASEITNEEENDDLSLVVTGFRTTAVVYPYRCFECEQEFTCSLEPDSLNHCPACGVEYTNVDTSALA